MNSLNVVYYGNYEKSTQKPITAWKYYTARYYEGRPERLESLQEERENAEIARKIYDLRKEAGLTQKETGGTDWNHTIGHIPLGISGL